MSNGCDRPCRGAEVKILAYEDRFATFAVAEDGAGNTEKVDLNQEAAANSRELLAPALVNSAEMDRLQRLFAREIRLRRSTTSMSADRHNSQPGGMQFGLAIVHLSGRQDSRRQSRRGVGPHGLRRLWLEWGPHAAEAIDTLAAASAEAGNFEAAIKWQTMAMKLAAENQQFQTGAQQRLKLYEQHQPYRDQSAFPLLPLLLQAAAAPEGGGENLLSPPTRISRQRKLPAHICPHRPLGIPCSRALPWDLRCAV